MDTPGWSSGSILFTGPFGGPGWQIPEGFCNDWDGTSKLPDGTPRLKNKEQGNRPACPARDKPDEIWQESLGALYNFPELNCCACGKPDKVGCNTSMPYGGTGTAPPAVGPPPPISMCGTVPPPLVAASFTKIASSVMCTSSLVTLYEASGTLGAPNHGRCRDMCSQVTGCSFYVWRYSPANTQAKYGCMLFGPPPGNTVPCSTWNTWSETELEVYQKD